MAVRGRPHTDRSVVLARWRQLHRHLTHGFTLVCTPSLQMASRLVVTQSESWYLFYCSGRIEGASCTASRGWQRFISYHPKSQILVGYTCVMRQFSEDVMLTSCFILSFAFNYIVDRFTARAIGSRDIRCSRCVSVRRFVCHKPVLC